MDFIKRHYEKLILLCMLILFIGIMVYVMQVAQQARDISIDDVQIKTLKADYQSENAKDSKYSVRLLVETDGRFDWPESRQRNAFASDIGGIPGARGSIAGTYSDLVTVFPISKCPHCQKLVPRYYFHDRKCPACGGELKEPPQRPKERRFVISENDSDGDGMPNAYEQSKGFDPKNPADGLEDADGDGFSNLYEFENNTDPKNATDRPPHWYRLKYITMESVDLPIRLMAVNTMDSKNKKSWNIQFNRIKFNRYGRPIIDPRTKQPREETLNQQLEDTIDIEELKYKITDVEYKVMKKGATTEQKDLSSVRLVQVLPPDAGKKKPDVLVMFAGKVVKSNDKRLIVEDVKVENNRPRFVLRLGGELTLGDKRSKTEKYRLVSVDESAKTAKFSWIVNGAPNPKDKDGKVIEVTRESMVPDELQVKTVKQRTAPAGGGGESPAGAPGRE